MADSGEYRRAVLTDVAAARVRVDPAEAIAILNAVCAALPAAASGPTFPAPAEIVLTSLGSVEILPGARHTPAHGARAALESLWSQTDPVRLRVFTVALESTTAASVDALVDLLGRQTPEDCANRIAGLVMRLPGATTSAARAEPRAVASPATRRRRAATVLSGAGALLAIAGLVLMSHGWIRTLRSAPPHSASGRVVGAAIAEIRSVVAGARRLIGAPAAVESPLAEDGASAGAAAPRRARSARQPVLEARRPDAAAADLPAGVSVATAGELPPAEAHTPAAPQPIAPVTVYTRGDADVIAPKMIEPAMLPDVPAGTPATDVSIVEVTVGADGDVSAVKLQPPLKRWDHVMLLSAIKTWKFEPAMRGGQPVPYRISMKLPTRW